MNIKNIFITTGISVLFSVYSIYNILEYLRLLNNHHIKKINSLQHSVNDTNKKYNELQKKYNDLSISYEHINQEFKLLHIKLIELQENKIDEIEINTDIPILHIDANVNEVKDDYIDLEFIESLTMDYEGNICSSEKRSRKRSNSIKEINWTGIAKKILFG